MRQQSVAPGRPTSARRIPEETDPKRSRLILHGYHQLPLGRGHKRDDRNARCRACDVADGQRQRRTKREVGIEDVLPACARRQTATDLTARHAASYDAARQDN